MTRLATLRCATCGHFKTRHFPTGCSVYKDSSGPLLKPCKCRRFRTLQPSRLKPPENDPFEFGGAVPANWNHVQ